MALADQKIKGAYKIISYVNYVICLLFTRFGFSKIYVYKHITHRIGWEGVYFSFNLLIEHIDKGVRPYQ